MGNLPAPGRSPAADGAGRMEPGIPGPHEELGPVTPGRGSIAARVALSGTVEEIPDVLEDAEYTNIEGQRLGGFRTLLGVPLLREGGVVNGRTSRRVRPYRPSARAKSNSSGHFRIRRSSQSRMCACSRR